MLPPLSLNAWMRYDIIRRALMGVAPGARLLEIGAGQGAIGARLARHHRYLGLEPDPISARVARPRIEASGGQLLEIYADALSPSNRFHVVCAFEVLEHIEDDVSALRSWVAHLEYGGILLLSVPAFQARFAAADRLAGHYRRYEPDGLRSRLESAGLVNAELWVTGFPFGLLLERGRNLVATVRPKAGGIEARTLESGRWRQPPDGLAWVTAAATLPFRWMQRPFLHTRFGTGIVARATR